MHVKFCQKFIQKGFNCENDSKTLSDRFWGKFSSQEVVEYRVSTVSDSSISPPPSCRWNIISLLSSQDVLVTGRKCSRSKNFQVLPFRDATPLLHSSYFFFFNFVLTTGSYYISYPTSWHPLPQPGTWWHQTDCWLPAVNCLLLLLSVCGIRLRIRNSLTKRDKLDKVVRLWSNENIKIKNIKMWTKKNSCKKEVKSSLTRSYILGPNCSLQCKYCLYCTNKSKRSNSTFYKFWEYSDCLNYRHNFFPFTSLEILGSSASRPVVHMHGGNIDEVLSKLQIPSTLTR